FWRFRNQFLIPVVKPLYVVHARHRAGLSSVARCASDNKIPHLVFGDERPWDEVVNWRILRNGCSTIEADKSVNRTEKPPVRGKLATPGYQSFNFLEQPWSRCELLGKSDPTSDGKQIDGTRVLAQKFVGGRPNNNIAPIQLIEIWLNAPIVHRMKS